MELLTEHIVHEFFGEGTLLRAAAAYEAATDWRSRRPEVAR